MGLFSSIGNAVGDAVNAVGSGLGAAAGAVGNVLGGQQPNTQSLVNPVNPQLAQMQQNQVNAANNYAQNLPSYEKQQQNAAADASRQQLAQGLAANTTNSNARGMLYGSYNQGQQAQTTAQNQANLQTTNANINTGDIATMQGLQAQALGNGVAINNSQNEQEMAAYQAALQQQLATNQAFGSFLGGAGAGAGLIAGMG